MNKRKGFTLAELIITLAVMAILLGVIFFTVSRRDTSYRKINAASDQILADIRYARQRAISEGRRVAIRFNRDSDFYEIIYQFSDELIRKVYLPDGITISNGNTLGFLPRGTPSGGSSIDITSEHHRARISVVGAGGRVRKEITKRSD